MAGRKKCWRLSRRQSEEIAKIANKQQRYLLMGVWDDLEEVQRILRREHETAKRATAALRQRVTVMARPGESKDAEPRLPPDGDRGER